jgi:hypothetical protein
MEIIDYSSELIKGEFIYRFTFEDDTDVFYTNDGWECINFNNTKKDMYYINKATIFYNKIVNEKLNN